MIVDDETYFRQYLKTVIDWKGIGFSICCEAYNGKDALEKIQAELPDVVLADINMPHLDGLSFAEQAIIMYPEVKIIFITGYSEFKYAKRALKLGVADYILKPFDKKELIFSLTAVKKELKKRKNSDKYIRNLQNKVNASMPALINSILFDAVRGVYRNKSSELKKNLQAIGIVLPKEKYFVASLETYVSQQAHGFNANKYKNNVMTVLGDILNEKSILFEGKSNQLVIITELKGDNGYKKCIIQLKRVVSELRNTVVDRATIGVGTQETNLKDLEKSYECSQMALKNKFILGNNKVIEYDELKIDNKNEEALPFDLKNDLFMHLRLLDKKKVNETLNEIHRIFKKQNLSIDYIYAYYNELITLCLSYITEYHFTESDIFGDGFNPFEEMQMMPTMKDVHEYISGLYNKLISTMYDRKKYYTIEIAEKAKKYIDENYHDHNLRVEDIAFNVFVHESYLRLLFKKHIGITIGQYLTETRMERAKDLLRNSNLSYADISQKTGYNDAAYFSKCFKKHYKVSPSEYRKSIILNES